MILSMIHLVGKRVVLFLTAFGIMLCLFVPAVAAQGVDVIGQGCKDVPGEPTLCTTNKPQPPGSNDLYGPNGVLTKIVKLLSTIIGVAAVIVIIVGAIRYALSSGDSSNINGAKNAILFALIGLIVALLARVVVVFVLNRIE